MLTMWFERGTGTKLRISVPLREKFNRLIPIYPNSIQKLGDKIICTKP